MRRHASLAALLLALSIVACASNGSGRSIAHLAQEQSVAPGSFAANRALGIAYYKAGRHAEARTALQTAARLEPNDGTTALYLGLTAEELGDFAAAKRAYSTYLEVGRTSRVRRQLEGRLAALTRRELAEDAMRAIQQERTLGAGAGSPTTVAVLPLRFSGGDSSLRPLERGFADLLTTDLSRSSKLTVVERARIQTLLDEIALQQSGRSDASTNVRVGRLLRAGRVVQGSILQVGGSQLRVDAAVLDVPTAEVRGSARGEDRLDQLFDLEKRIALGLFDELGVTLTVAERNTIEQRPTRSLAAFLAYSRGLTAEDDGHFDDAGRFYRDALRIDPGFGAALQRNRDATLITGARQTGHALEAGLGGTSEGAAGDSRGRGSEVADAAHAAADDLNPSAAGAASAPPRLGRHQHRQARKVRAREDRHQGTEATMTPAVRRLGRVAVASLAALVVASTAGAQSIFDGEYRLAPQWVQYQIHAPSDVTVSELAIPVFVSVPAGSRMSFDVGTAYARARVSSGAEHSDVSGLTDVQLRAQYTLGSDLVVLTGGINLPTGNASVSLDQLAAASLIGNDFLAFPVSNMGTGLAVTGGAAMAYPLGIWNVGAGASVRRTRAYEPFAVPGQSFRYQPGNEVRHG